MRRALPALMAGLVTLFFAEGQRALFAAMFGLEYEALFPVVRPVPALIGFLPVLVVLAPLVPLARWTDREAAIAIPAIGAGLFRIPMSHPSQTARLAAGALVVAFGIAFVAWAVGRVDRRSLATGMVGGLVADQLLRLAGTSWDLSLQPGWWPVQVVLSIALVAIALLWYRDPEPEPASSELERRAGGLRLRGGLALGALLFMELHVVSLPPVAARLTGVGYDLAAVTLAGGGAAALFLTLAAPRPTGGRATTLVLVGLLAAGPLLARPFDGLLFAGLMALAHLAGLLLLTRALDPASGRRSGRMVAAAFGVFFVATALYATSFYAAFTLPALEGAVPWIFGAVGVLLAACFVLLPRPAELALEASTLRGAVGAGAVMLISVVLLWTGPDRHRPPATGEPDRVRVVSWNLHFGFDEDWTFVPGAMAEVLEREEADLVALQEVVIGAPTAYGMDLPLWLARRVGLRDHFSPTVNDLLGDAFLSRLRAIDRSSLQLPAGGGDPKQLHTLTVPVGGVPVSFHALHLGTRPEARPPQIRTALAAVGTGPAVVLGDLNTESRSPVTAALRDAGFRDALVASPRPTFPARAPAVRIDWIWVRGLEVSGAEVLPDTPSDHRAVAATLHIPAGQIR